jgi:hypothetical protein
MSGTAGEGDLFFVAAEKNADHEAASVITCRPAGSESGKRVSGNPGRRPSTTQPLAAPPGYVGIVGVQPTDPKARAAKITIDKAGRSADDQVGEPPSTRRISHLSFRQARRARLL